MDTTKLTIEQLGDKVKAKYPQYANIDSKELGMRTLDKYPEYQTRIKPEQSGFFASIKEDLAKRGENVNDAFNRDQSFVSKTLQLIGQGAGFVGDIVGEGIKSVGRGISAITPDIIEKPFVGGAKKLGVGILNTSLGQAGLRAIEGGVESYNQFKQENPETARNLEAVVNIASLLPIGKGAQIAGKGAIKGGEVVGGVVKEGAEAVGNVAKAGASKVGNVIKSTAGDIIPTKKGFTNTEIIKALDFTDGDAKKIYQSTGNKAGEFIFKNNLLGDTVQATKQKLDDYFTQNYTAVRDEIGKVTKPYTIKTVPRYTDALEQIKKTVNDVVGLEDVNKEVDTLLKNKKPILADVQRVKELMDEQFNLYKVTGDVQAGRQKAGLEKMRNEIKQFIENEVKTNTGADIAKLNNNVASAKTISNAIDDRITRGSTRATLTASDIVTFLTGSGFATPIGGIGALLGKKLYQSPTFKIKFVKWLNRKSGAEKAKILQDLKSGVTPKGLKAVTDKKR